MKLKQHLDDNSLFLDSSDDEFGRMKMIPEPIPN